MRGVCGARVGDNPFLSGIRLSQFCQGSGSEKLVFLAGRRSTHTHTDADWLLCVSKRAGFPTNFGQGAGTEAARLLGLALRQQALVAASH